ncbi:hypothetical protein EPN15_00330 [Patescibacteria group bacterium]|nr:MAG: hypothetical protein EPN15_00330 [Patescibacteria group bacterium]
MYYNREIEEKIIPFLKRKEVLAILGPRQAGKTTFLWHLADELRKIKKKVNYITFEKRADLKLFNESIEDFKSLVEPYDCVIIDEFQYASEGGQKLKYLYDETEVKFIISGSSSLELTFQTGKFMVGRMIDFTLLPFSFQEFLAVKNKDIHRILMQKKFNDLIKFDPKKSFGPEVNRRLAAFLEEYVLFGGVSSGGNFSEQRRKKENIGKHN